MKILLVLLGCIVETHLMIEDEINALPPFPFEQCFPSLIFEFQEPSFQKNPSDKSLSLCQHFFEQFSGASLLVLHRFPEGCCTSGASPLLS